MFFWRLLFQENIADIWNYWWIKYLGKCLSYLKSWGVGVNYCWNYEPSKLLLHFIEYRLDQLNSTHTNSSKLDNTVFWRLLSKEISAKSLMFFGPPTTKWRPCKIFVKLNSNYLLMANIFKLHKYKTFGLMKMNNMCKITYDLQITYSVCGKVWFTINGPSKMLFFNFCLFLFSKFQMTIVKIFIMDFEGF